MVLQFELVFEIITITCRIKWSALVPKVLGSSITQGQKLDLLINGLQSAGYHEKRFTGEKLASGVYFVRMIGGDAVGREAYRPVSKLVLTK